METTELIQAVRGCSANRECKQCPFFIANGSILCVNNLLNAAADRLEELDECVAIMSEGEQVTMEELVKGGKE